MYNLSVILLYRLFLVLRLKMRGAVPPLPHASSWLGA
jgi:hypothetical protein